MQPARGTIVISLAGRDKDKYLAVISADEKTLYLANGKLRSIVSPKKKNIKHVSITGTVLDEEMLLYDKRLRNAIKEVFRSDSR
ncbi:MAG: KOW domain-containing RNA-binding protein [Oscillospiraceae bacterium]|nr:KOW domain-containing RNA-binding protein [Oscillospiraceae bacterium]